jgi:hypothetical protein
MNYQELSQLQRELVFLLKEEYSFYQSLYITLDKQRELIKYDRDGRLLDLFAEIERCHQRIKQSEAKVAALKDKNPKLFKQASNLPEIKKIVNSIVTLIKKNMSVVAENESYLTDRYERIRSELDSLKNSQKILQYFREGDPSPQFVDGKK